MAFVLFTPLLHLYHLLIPNPDTAGSGGSPNGVLTARAGTKVWDTTTARWYINTDGATTWVILGGSGVGPLLTGSVATPAANDVAGVHAAFAGNDVSNDFPGPFTNPDVPRSAQLTFGLGYDGGDVLLTGTSGLGVAQTETVTNPGAGGGVVETAKVWTTITAASKAAVGANPATVSIGLSDKLATSSAITAVGGIVTCDDVDDPATWDRANSSFRPTQAPNGAHTYRYAIIG